MNGNRTTGRHDEFTPLFSPQAVAVLGASSAGKAPANAFIRRLRAFGYAGTIYPIHRTAARIEDLTAYPTLAQTPTPVDYAYVAIPAESAVEALEVAPPGWVRFAQVIASGFSETQQGATLERRLFEAAQAAGTRLIGPNCLGTHSTSSRLTFIENAETSTGPVSLLAQSGGLSVDMLRRGYTRGLRFARVVTLGNCTDVGFAELFDYLLDDPETGLIGLYVEQIADGRSFFEKLRRAGGRKPVVLLKGGRTGAGQRAAASHTGQLASNDRLWVAMARQTGTIMLDKLDDFLDALLTLQCLKPNPAAITRKVLLFGNGGGTSVLGTDCLQRHGFDVPVLDDATRAALEALRLPPGSSILNPIDTPASALRAEEGRIVRRILAAIDAHADVDAIVMHVNVTVLFGYRDATLLQNVLTGALQGLGGEASRKHFLLVLRSDGDVDVEIIKREYRRQAVLAGIPVFDEIDQACVGLRALRTVEEFDASYRGQ